MKKRTLRLIERELQVAMRNRTKDVLRIGALLLEAKGQVDHGEWLGWLRAQTGFLERSAQNFMNAARFAAKYATVADLKLRPSALYRLAKIHFSAAKNDGYDPEVEAKVRQACFAEARGKWLDLMEVYQIEGRLTPKPPKPDKPPLPRPEPPIAYESFSHPICVDEAATYEVLQQLGATGIGFHGDYVRCSIPVGRAQQARDALARAADSAALLDDPPPLPPEMAPAGSPKAEADDDAYKQAIAALDRLRTKPIDRWVGLAPLEQVQHVADMLNAILATRRDKAA
jgi:hypothetical protein